ncbi:MAG: hypothetical protein ACRYG7_09335 [Janthinobacterium lividum]
MVKKLLLLLLFAFTLRPAAAQHPVTDESLASQQYKQRLRGQYLHNDTAQAIINLYGRRQGGGVGWMVAAGLSALRFSLGGGSSTNLNTSPYYQPSSSDTGANVGAAFLVATPIAAYGLGKLLHYSNAHLNEVLTAYAAGQPLPHSLRRKLKPRFFAEPIVKYKEVKVKPVK